MKRAAITVLWLVSTAVLSPATASAQSLGTFRWQLQPFCNVLTVAVTQTGSLYRLEGTDNQCGDLDGHSRGAVTGLAFPNPDGTIGFGLTIVTGSGGEPVHVYTHLTLATLGGTWRDSAGNAGSFVFTPGAGTGGPQRPTPAAAIPEAIRLLSDGGLVARVSGVPGPIPTSGPGARMMWYPGRAAFRVGNVNGLQWDETFVGSNSVATGFNTVASGVRSSAFGDTTAAFGEASTALGLGTSASGRASTAMGLNTLAGGEAGTALGSSTSASGPASLASGALSTSSGAASAAFGRNTLAGGSESVAFGQNTIASGVRAAAFGLDTSATGNRSAVFGNGSISSGSDSLAAGAFAQSNGAQSFALGLRVVAGADGSIVLGSDATTQAAATGTFIFADRSTANDVVGFAPNEFIARAAGGVGFYTNAALTTGVEMAANGSSWAPLSDANAKENFREVDGEDLLAKLARIPVREWNYKAQDAAIRHMGPTAQDFRAAFGLGDFELRINTVDADGVALAGVQALEARTRALPQQATELERLTAQNTALLAQLAALEARLGRLEQLLTQR